MEKLNLNSMHGVELNIEKLATIFPECVTESKVNGEIQKVVNFDMLNLLLSKEKVSTGGGRH